MTESSIAQKNPASWTKVYWPTALAIGVLGFMAADIWKPEWRGAALAIGAALILIPEITVIALHRSQDTFSDWTWGVLDVTRNQGFGQWTATHFLALILYLVIVIKVLTYLWQHGNTWLALAATGTAVWLFRHLFWGLWR